MNTPCYATSGDTLNDGYLKRIERCAREAQQHLEDVATLSPEGLSVLLYLVKANLDRIEDAVRRLREP